MNLRNQIAIATLLAAGLGLAGAAVAQQSVTSSPAADQVRSTYLLGPDDQITVHALDADEINDKPFRIDGDGYIRLALAGRIKASGMTIEQLETTISDRLKVYIKDPQVAVSVVEFRSQPVSILGSVHSPGVHQLEGHKTVIEMISLAGGLSDDAGHTLKITRRMEWGRIPLPTAVDDPTGRFSVADINLQEIMDAKNPAQNVLIAPEDVISVPRAQMVYVIGTVLKPGGYVLGDSKSFSVLKVVSLAGGVDHFAAPQKARIMRPVAGNSNREEIPVNLKAIMAGTSGDVPLQPEDILFIPSNGPQKALARAAEAAIQVGTFAVYKF